MAWFEPGTSPRLRLFKASGSLSHSEDQPNFASGVRRSPKCQLVRKPLPSSIRHAATMERIVGRLKVLPSNSRWRFSQGNFRLHRTRSAVKKAPIGNCGWRVAPPPRRAKFTPCLVRLRAKIARIRCYRPARERTSNSVGKILRECPRQQPANRRTADRRSPPQLRGLHWCRAGRIFVPHHHAALGVGNPG